MAFATSHLVLRDSLQSSWWWRFATHSVLTCLTSFLASHSLWMESVVMFHRTSPTPCCELTSVCLHGPMPSPVGGRVHRKDTFSLRSWAFLQWLFVGGKLEKSAHAWTCCYWQILSKAWTQAIRQLLDVLQRIDENIYSTWHNSLLLLLQAITLHLISPRCIHSAMFMYSFCNGKSFFFLYNE